MHTRYVRRGLALAIVAGLAAPATAGGPVSGSIILKEGDALDGSTVTSVNAPFTNGLGQVGFVAVLDDARRAIWYDNAPIFTSDMAAPDALTGGEGTMGIGNAGQFIYSPSFNGDDAVWGQDGLIAVENTQAPDFAAGLNSTFHSRPQMTDDGTAYWIAGINDGAGGTSSVERVLYRRDTGGVITGLYRAGDVVDGATIATGSGIDFDFAFSGNNAHSMVLFNDAAQATTADARLAVNDVIVAGEGLATGQGDNWDNFDAMSVNNAGNYVFSGDTDGGSDVDEFIAYNGAIALREGDVIGSGALDGSVDALSINNNNEAVFIWDIDDAGGDIETLFYASDASNMVASTVALLSVGDLFDADGDNVADWIIDDFNASAGIGPGLDLAEDGLVYVEVDLESLDGLVNIEAIISLRVPAPSGAALLGMSGLLAARRRR